MKKHLVLLIGSSLLAVSTVAMFADGASAKGNGKNKNSDSNDQPTAVQASCNLNAFSGVSGCEGPISGNNSNQNLDGLFDIDWESGSFVSGEIKVDNGSGGSTGGFSFSGNKQSGTWELDKSITNKYQYGMFVVKAGNSFASYFWDGLSTSGAWDTKGVIPNGGGSPDLSHFSFYGFGQRVVEPEVPTIPEPAAMLGLLSVGGVIAATRRKKLQQA
ncbi:PEP-CTERM sorting domain-containing protein [Halomicronema sp. CCY15110]|uniref:PEP-CTERM sorting domain-containing protein n=1 Tax=Halomicronema sp. CCY15110 TaxID=2767773 RepID=UPI0019528D27|nr:PEP-CTERM sorting domain-containing protein [Halomicronema sp. CCY15110]